MASCSFSTLLERVTACGLSSCYPGHVEVVSLKECTRHISRHLQLHGLSADKAVDSEFKLLLARAGNVIAFCSGITVFDNFGHGYFVALGVPQSRFCRVTPLPCPRAPGMVGLVGIAPRCWFSSLLRGFFSGYSGFPPSIKTNISKFQFDLDVGP